MRWDHNCGCPVVFLREERARSPFILDASRWEEHVKTSSLVRVPGLLSLWWCLLVTSSTCIATPPWPDVLFPHRLLSRAWEPHPFFFFFFFFTSNLYLSSGSYRMLGPQAHPVRGGRPTVGAPLCPPPTVSPPTPWCTPLFGCWFLFGLVENVVLEKLILLLSFSFNPKPYSALSSFSRLTDLGYFYHYSHLEFSTYIFSMPPSSPTHASWEASFPFWASICRIVHPLGAF